MYFLNSQPIKEIFSRVRELKRDAASETEKILLHTDAAQALGKILVNVDDLSTDYLTIVGHKVIVLWFYYILVPDE